jgi:hypothetical protein
MSTENRPISTHQTPTQAASSLGLSSPEISSYIKVGSTNARTIRWLIFAIAICVGATALVLLAHHFGNPEFALNRRLEIQKKCFGSNASASITSCSQPQNECEKFICSPEGGGDRVKANSSNDAWIAELRRTLAETRLVELPLINVKVITPDFAIVLVALSIFFMGLE